jgi:uncharacterized delta-60 repeat protein
VFHGERSAFLTRATVILPNANLSRDPMKSLLPASIVCAAFSALTLPATAAPGDLEAFTIDANGPVNSAMVQPDGLLVLGGEFAFMNGVQRLRIVRFDTAGVWDPAFGPAADSNVYCTAVQRDGNILVGGVFANMDGVLRDNIARLHADGSLDTTFDPAPDDWVGSMALQPDGQIVIGGAFHFVGTVNPVPRRYVARIRANGSLDPNFDPNAFDEVYSTLVQPDGKILLGGAFIHIGATVPRNRIARVLADGFVDTGFDPNADGRVHCMALQADGKILLGGDFTHVGGVARNHIARVNANGTLDTLFDPSAGDRVYSMTVQADGKIVIGGLFLTIGGSGRSFLARLNADGSVDTGFNPPIPNNSVQNTSLQANGKVLAGGAFTKIGLTTRDRIARFDNGPVTESLTAYTSTRVQWLRGGTAPEVEQVTFELSTNGGTVWMPLGAGTRINGGWELNVLTLPASGHLRARARTSGGKYNGSSGMVETVAPFTAIFGGGFHITSITRSGQNLTFKFPTVAGYHYTLWHTSSLNAVWVDTGLTPISSNGSEQTFTLPMIGGDVYKRFYRVQVDP